MAGPSLSPLLAVLLSLALASAGQGAQDTGERIINGVPCPRGFSPWQVALFQGDKFGCAGVLIHEQWVLTVAHCYLSEYIVQLGSDRLVDENAQRIRANESFIHHGYVNIINIHDIMLVKLSSPAKLTSTVKIAELPSSCKDPGTNCSVSGWGRNTTNTVTNPTELMCSNVSLISFKDCRKYYPIVLRKFMMCAAHPNGLTFPCKDDYEICNSKRVFNLMVHTASKE
ncbi:kallikrein-7-like [Saccopteryx leptura]|uniref:kallikrein-7-like n=1 Tax=Saccopteryx leptura TaxID=249018 RepID=UPI00339D2209